MAGSSAPQSLPTPTITPLGDTGILVRFGSTLTDAANRAAIALALALERTPVAGVVEVVPNLVSVQLRYEPGAGISPAAIAGELRLRLFALSDEPVETAHWSIAVRFNGPDLDAAGAALGMGPQQFVAMHNARPLRVLATGFAPGFVYIGLHPDELVLPRRTEVRPAVPPGSVLFAAGQTAITATEMPTGWHVIGHTDFSNFDPRALPPTRLQAGDLVKFEVAS